MDQVRLEGSRGTYLIDPASVREGGQALVYSAVAGDRRLAVKVARGVGPHLARERDALAKLRDAHSGGPRWIVELIDSGRTADGRDFIVLDWYQHSLETWLQRFPPLLDILRVLEACADVVTRLHRAADPRDQYLHRDIKPSNFLIDLQHEGPRVVLADLGGVKDGRLLSITVFEGLHTMGFAPLEQSLPLAQRPDPSWDVHALAVTIYVAICGRVPDAKLGSLRYTPQALRLVHLHHTGLARTSREDDEYAELARRPAQHFVDLEHSSALTDRDVARLVDRFGDELTQFGSAAAVASALALPLAAELRSALEPDPRLRVRDCRQLHAVLIETREALEAALPIDRAVVSPPPVRPTVPVLPATTSPRSWGRSIAAGIVLAGAVVAFQSPLTTHRVRTSGWATGVIDLANGDAVEFYGREPREHLGCDFAVGDFNGDSVDDVAMSACTRDGPTNGAVHLLAGVRGTGPWGGVRTSEWGGTAYTKGDDKEVTGVVMAGGADLTGDGIADVAVGAPNYESPQSGENAGRAFVLPGGADLVDAEWNAIAEMKGTAPWTFVASTVATGADANGGFLLVGAPWYDDPAYRSTQEGAVWLFEGPLSGTLDAKGADTISFTIGSSDCNPCWLGESVALGDLDADGILEAALGATNTPPPYGGVYIASEITARDEVHPIAVTTDADRVIVSDATTGNGLGGFVGVPGDVDGDGNDDLVVQARLYGDPPEEEFGSLVLLLGGRRLTSGGTSTTSSSGDAFFFGTASWVGAGRRVSGGDVDGNGLADLLIAGTSGGFPPDRSRSFQYGGSAWLYYGNESPSGTFELEPGRVSGLGATFVDTRAPDGRLGLTVALADMDADGLDDIWLGSFVYPDFGLEKSEQGAAFLLLSGNERTAHVPTETVDAATNRARPAQHFAIFVAQSPRGPGNNRPSAWKGVLQYTAAGDGAPLFRTVGIPAKALHDPYGLAYRRSSDEVFVGNRHGNVGADGTRGSIQRFLYDRSTRTLVENGTITGNGLDGVHQLTFHPTTGELFAANMASGISRFLFDSDGVAVPNGMLGTGIRRGVAVSPTGSRLYTTSGDTVVTYDLATGAKVGSVLVEEGLVLNDLAIQGAELYATAVDANRIHRLVIDSSDSLTWKSSFHATAPAGIAFSTDGLELFTSANGDAGPIQRFRYDPASDAWNLEGSHPTPGALGSMATVEY
jgi:serine/threonine protein kinase